MNGHSTGQKLTAAVDAAVAAFRTWLEQVDEVAQTETHKNLVALFGLFIEILLGSVQSLIGAWVTPLFVRQAELEERVAVLEQERLKERERGMG